MNTGQLSLIVQWFVGRESYLEEFKSFIQGKAVYRVLFIDGPGGIGKTWLLRKMMATAQAMRAQELLVGDDLIDMYSTSNHSVEGVQEHLQALLENVSGHQAFTKFRQSQHELVTAKRENFQDEILIPIRKVAGQNFIDDCRRLSIDRKVVLFLDTFERVQSDPVGGWILKELARDLPNFRFVIASREGWRGNTLVHTLSLKGFSSSEARKYFEKRGLGELESRAMDVIREKVLGHPLLIELALEWLNGNLLRDIQRLKKISRNELEEALIAPLQEIGQGLFGLPGFDEAIHQTILFMAFFNRRFNSEILGLLVAEGFVDLQSLKPEDVLEKLEREFFFVKTRPDGFIQLHDEMEPLIKKYLWVKIDPSRELQRELALIVCRWYDQQIEYTSGKPVENELKAEQIKYLISANPELALSRLDSYGYDFTFNNLLVVEISPEDLTGLPAKFRYRFASNMGARAHQINQYEKGQAYWQIALDIAGQSDNTDDEIDALLGQHHKTQYVSLDESLKIVNKALELCERSETRRAKVLYEKGHTYRLWEDIENALKFFSQAQNAASTNKDQELMATLLNDIGYARVFTGEYKRAGYLVKSGLDLRKESVRQIEIQLSKIEKQISEGSKDDLVQEKEKLEHELLNAQLKLGMSFNTLGQIKRFDGDLAAATGAYSEAFQIFKQKEINDRLWQARALHSRGEAHRRIAETLYEQGRVGASQDYVERARKDFQESIEYCEQYGLEYAFKKEFSTAARRMGRLFHDQALREPDIRQRLKVLEQARSYFEKGLDMSTNVENVLEELENLTELAFLVDDRLATQKTLSTNNTLSRDQVRDGEQDIKRLRDSLKRHGKDRVKIFQFDVFLHLLEMEEGAFRFSQGKRKEALEYYLKAYLGLAKLPGYGVTRYRQHLNHLFKRIRELDNPEEEKRWCNTFIAAWQDTTEPYTDKPLAQAHPELVERMQLYLDTAFLFRE